jgi:predicted phage-related endonuclease
VIPQIHKNLTEAEWLAMRTQDVTSTETAALFGASPYLTEFELYHRKRDGDVIQIADNERMRWGRRLEPVIAAGVAEDRGWTIAPLKSYARDPELRMGSSFDFEVLCPQRGLGLLEVKNVDFLAYRNGWVDDAENREAPVHIEIQLQHQLEIMEGAYSWGAIVALVGGNTPKVIERDWNREVGQAIRRAIRSFWQMVEAGTPPAPSFPDDIAAVRKVYGFAEPGKILDARGNEEIATLVRQIASASAQAKAAQEQADTFKAQLLMMIDEAETVTGDGFKISAGMVPPAEVSYTRAGYRNLRTYWSKQK